MPSFRFRLVPFIVTLLLVMLGCSLSWWQTQRAIQKEAIEEKIRIRERIPPVALPLHSELAQMEYARVVLKGEFIKEWPIYLDNRPMNGQVGIVVVMPFKLQDRPNTILIARGWVPRNARDRSAIKQYQTPSGIIQLEGIIKANAGHVLQLGQSAPLAPNTLVQNVEVSSFIQASQLPTAPYIVEQTSMLDDGLERNWSRPSAGADRHWGYAFQWLALAVTALLFFLVTGFKYGRQSEQ